MRKRVVELGAKGTRGEFVEGGCEESFGGGGRVFVFSVIIGEGVIENFVEEGFRVGVALV